VVSWVGMDEATQPISQGRHALEPDAGACPAAVLVTEQERGGFIVQGYPTGPAVHVSAKDGWMLRQALDAAFEVNGIGLDVPPIVKPRI